MERDLLHLLDCLYETPTHQTFEELMNADAYNRLIRISRLCESVRDVTKEHDRSLWHMLIDWWRRKPL